MLRTMSSPTHGIKNWTTTDNQLLTRNDDVSLLTFHLAFHIIVHKETDLFYLLQHRQIIIPGKPMERRDVQDQRKRTSHSYERKTVGNETFNMAVQRIMSISNSNWSLTRIVIIV